MNKKSVKLSSVIALLAVLTGCGGNHHSPTDDLLTVDVTADYPEKELLLQDLMEVEYLPLETTDEFITKGHVEAVGKNILLVTNQNRDGDIFVFDRTGKGLRKINRFGQSGEEYTQVTEIIWDEDNQEMFIKDYPARKINVYDVLGNFKRSFKFADDCYYTELFDYDPAHLLGYKGYLPGIENEQSRYVLISKHDGHITLEIPIPFTTPETPVMQKGELSITPGFNLTTPYGENWMLMKPSSDTIYRYGTDGRLTPFLVRIPSIQDMDTQVFLFLNALTDRYCFLQTLKKEVDFTTFKGYPGEDLVYDRAEKSLFSYTVYNADFSTREAVSFHARPVNREITLCEALYAPDLVEAYEKGQLKGRLKEITAHLNEESNPVIMLVKPKK